jgi:alkylation response protein AidB-like acyl-CoA dehydrogenase
VITGSKRFITGAGSSDLYTYFAVTNPDAPKGKNITAFLVSKDMEGFELGRKEDKMGIRGSPTREVILEDCRVPAENVIGEVNGGWEVASRMLFHERTSVGGGSPYFSGKHRGSGGSMQDLVEIARRTGQLDDVRVREDIGEARAMRVVSEQLIARVSKAISTGAMPAAASSIIRLFSAETAIHQNEAAIKIAGALGVTGDSLAEPGLGILGQDYLFKQAWSLAGGSTEISRNIVSERVLGMPREYAADRDVPFDQVKQGR